MRASRPGRLSWIVVLGATLGLAFVVACNRSKPELVLFVDSEGYFVTDPASFPVDASASTPASGSGSWLRGAGVRFVHRADGEFQPPMGRLDPDAGKATLYRIGEPDGMRSLTFDVRPAPSGFDPKERVLAPLRALDEAPDIDPETKALLRRLRATSQPVRSLSEFDPDPIDIAPGDGPPQVGEDLAAWAPTECAFARSRSIAAAFRMAGELDRLAELWALVPADDVGSGSGETTPDRQTLRLTLHHLLLPTIWNTNPGAETGVVEVGVVIAPPFAPGVLRAALLLRIEDPELHYMQTTAGISQEGQDDHLWRPDDDPFPEERVRHPFRSTVGDVEIVATDQALHDVLAKGVARPLASDRGYLAARQEAGPVVPDEALFVYVPPDVDTSSSRWRAACRAALREEAGWRHLLNGWCGDVDLRPRGVLNYGLFAREARLAPLALFSRLRWLRLVTDPDGALGELRSYGSATPFARKFSADEVPGPHCDKVCAKRRQLLSQLGRYDKRGAMSSERAFVLIGRRPVCPTSGTYSAHPLTDSIACSTHGSAESPRPGPAVALPIRDVIEDADRVSFRLEIAWKRRQ